LPALTPDGDSMNEIYRKQTQRLEELEKENKQLTKDHEAAQSRQQKMEDELEELRGTASQVAEFKSRSDKVSARDEEITKLVRILSRFCRRAKLT
jgi:predicted nuclease with TOPRIM domain